MIVEALAHALSLFSGRKTLHKLCSVIFLTFVSDSSYCHVICSYTDIFVVFFIERFVLNTCTLMGVHINTLY